MKKRSCDNCKNRYFSGWDGVIESCMWYEIISSEKKELLEQEAENCKKYEYGTPACLGMEEERYTPSATAGDYSPSAPWNAPGMSIHDFI